MVEYDVFMTLMASGLQKTRKLQLQILSHLRKRDSHLEMFKQKQHYYYFLICMLHHLLFPNLSPFPISGTEWL